jgi:hypothetical protein
MVYKESKGTLWVRVMAWTVGKRGVRARTVCKGSGRALWVRVRLRTVHKGRVRPVYNSKLISQLGTSLRQNPSWP